jgi:hypothetical protein
MIPATAHFVWLGRRFPFLLGISVLSAAKFGGFTRVVVHCDSDIRHTPGWSVCMDDPRIVWQPLNEKVLLNYLESIGADLFSLYQRLTQPAARSNIIRLAILYKEGGVYLDTDVITVNPFTRVRTESFFCGAEHIALPASLYNTRSPVPWIKAAGRLVLRDILRRIPRGWLLFKKLNRMYPEVVNNAVMGASPGCTEVYKLLAKMLKLPEDRQTKRFALGTHLLESAVAEGEIDIRVLPPSTFFPLGPEISEHWFKRSSHIHLDDFLSSETICIHWYASVRTRKFVAKATLEWVNIHRDTIPICRLVHMVRGGDANAEKGRLEEGYDAVLKRISFRA